MEMRRIKRDGRKDWIVKSRFRWVAVQILRFSGRSADRDGAESGGFRPFELGLP